MCLLTTTITRFMSASSHLGSSMRPLLKVPGAGSAAMAAILLAVLSVVQGRCLLHHTARRGRHPKKCPSTTEKFLARCFC